MYLVRTLLGYSLHEVGRAFKRDHTTVVTAERRISALLVKGGADAGKVKTITAIITGAMNSAPACCESCGRPLEKSAA